MENETAEWKTPVIAEPKSAAGLSYTQESNRRYELATDAEKRVMIALDGIRAIEADIFNIKKGVYFDPETIEAEYAFRDVPADTSVREIFKDYNFQNCGLCAKGAVFACVVARQNKVTAGEFKDMVGDDGRGKWTGRKMVAKLGGVFDAKTLRAIETEFEGRDCEVKRNGTGAATTKEMKPVMKLVWLDSEAQRLIVLLRNIADNGGELVREEPTEEVLDLYRKNELPDWTPPLNRWDVVVHVTQKDIDGGVCMNARSCATATALMRALRARFRRWKDIDVLVGADAIAYRRIDGQVVEVLRDSLPIDVKQWVDRFDETAKNPEARKDLKPFSFVVTLKPEVFLKNSGVSL